MSQHTSIGERGRVALAEQVHFRQIEGDLVVLDLARGDYYSLNAVGARMLQALVSGKSPAEVAAELAPEYDADGGMLIHDCIALADELIERGILRRCS